MKYIACFLVSLLLVSPIPVQAQTSTSTTNLVSTQFDTSDFPQWAKDLRRGEIVAFGSFPFMMLFTSVAMDSYRWYNNNWDNRYAPFFLKSAGAVEMTETEQIITLTSAIAGSIVIALVDYFIVLYKRNKQAKIPKNVPGETPIIIRKPLAEESPRGNPATEATAESGSP
jgi:hypothetical protein